MKLIITAVLILLLNITSYSETYFVTTQDNKLAKVIIDYESTQQEKQELDYRIDTWYQHNKTAKDKYYILRARNYISRTMQYDYDYQNTGMRSFTPYPLLDNKKMVCMGYTALMQRLLDKKGIINILVYDTRITHIYNRILLDDWIDIDVTSYKYSPN